MNKTNNKFKNIIRLEVYNCNFLFYFSEEYFLKHYKEILEKSNTYEYPEKTIDVLINQFSNVALGIFETRTKSSHKQYLTDKFKQEITIQDSLDFLAFKFDELYPIEKQKYIKVIYKNQYFYIRSDVYFSTRFQTGLRVSMEKSNDPNLRLSYSSDFIFDKNEGVQGKLIKSRISLEDILEQGFSKLNIISTLEIK